MGVTANERKKKGFIEKQYYRLPVNSTKIEGQFGHHVYANSLSFQLLKSQIRSFKSP